MILAIDVGNTQIFAGVFEQDKLIASFRWSSHYAASSDEYGLFLRSALRENDIDPDHIKNIGICSVVPERVHSLANCSAKYFGIKPFVLKAGVKTGLKIKYQNPREVGPDRIADAIAVTHLYPNQNILVIDFGTATTIEVITKRKEYLGGAIFPGVRLCMEALEKNTSRLPSVEIVKPSSVVGRTTTESIQNGLFYGTLGAIKEMKHNILSTTFTGEPTLTVGTGGFASLFEAEDLFDERQPNLVLQGLYIAMGMNL